jgi:hypothetical protein
MWLSQKISHCGIYLNVHLRFSENIRKVSELAIFFLGTNSVIIIRLSFFIL